ncbi:hypothetical protein IQ249_11255 [Lusitaniella coriacea LEGE 07157]|uniref:Uncharacterized protein n=1 Tax=Lusitaniella coriacea LEGE 07157 TaxID=945747 RepID=A0A8J7ISX7_9CYAN|nr:hypothetical protein [Lusitaniella coriacea]MBE9116477.1 hypothetical protein [Lusitaniella coriacea LEGE 07157]
MKIVKGLKYRDWQKRNKEHFESLSSDKQKKARKQGYCNRGWKKVISSWKILCKAHKKISSLFDYKLSQGDLIGAIDLSILEADKAKETAKLALKELNENQKKLDKLANEALQKYSPL